MGNKLGKATKMDRTTASVLQGRFARVCVEVDLNEPLIPCTGLMGHVRRVEYKGLHIICFHCGRYGHHQEHCSRLVHEKRQGGGLEQGEYGDRGQTSEY